MNARTRTRVRADSARRLETAARALAQAGQAVAASAAQARRLEAGLRQRALGRQEGLAELRGPWGLRALAAKTSLAALRPLEGEVRAAKDRAGSARGEAEAARVALARSLARDRALARILGRAGLRPGG